MFLDWLAALADPVVKLFSTVLTNSSNERNVDATNEANRDIASQTNESQMAIHQSDNAFNAEQAALNRKFQKEQSDLAYQRTTLGSKMSQARAAGVNPFLALSSGNPMAQAMSGSQATSASSPSLVAPKMEAFQALNPFQGVNIFEGMKTLAEAKKLGVESKRYNMLMQLEAQEKSEQIRGLQIANTLNHLFGFAKNKAELELMYGKVKLTSQEVLNAIEQNDFIKAQTILTRWKSKTELELSRYHGKQADLAQMDIDTYYEKVDAQINAAKAQANQANANAGFTTEQAKQLREMHDDIVKLKSYERQSSLADLKEKATTLESRIEVILNTNESLLESQRLDLQKLRYELDQVKFARDTQAITYIFDRLEQINKGITAWIPFAGYDDTQVNYNSYSDSEGFGYNSVNKTTRTHKPKVPFKN